MFCGPVGVGKSFLAQALGHAACRANYRVLFLKADQLLKTLAAFFRAGPYAPFVFNVDLPSR